MPNHGSTSFSYTTIWTVISDNCRLGRENLTYTYIMHPGLRSAYLAFAEQLRVMVTQIGCVAAPRSNFLLTAPADRAAILDQLSQRILIKNKIRPDFRFGFFEGGKMLWEPLLSRPPSTMTSSLRNKRTLRRSDTWIKYLASFPHHGYRPRRLPW